MSTLPPEPRAPSSRFEKTQPAAPTPAPTPPPVPVQALQPQQRFDVSHPTIAPQPKPTVDPSRAVCGNCIAWKQQMSPFVGECIANAGGLGTPLYRADTDNQCSMPMALRERKARAAGLIR